MVGVTITWAAHSELRSLYLLPPIVGWAAWRLQLRGAAPMRDAMCTDDHVTAGLYFGGRNGSGVVLTRPGRDLVGDPQGPPRCDGCPGASL